jgi:transcriptional regulator with XRE-family HTH domain
VALRETFGSNLRHYRMARDLKQHELAERAGLTTNMVGRLERGRVAPSFKTIEKIAAVLEIPEAALFGADVLTLPTGERGRLLQRINAQLSKLNNDALARAAKLIRAMTE